jgi:hypothetical protein
VHPLFVQGSARSAIMKFYKEVDKRSIFPPSEDHLLENLKGMEITLPEELVQRIKDADKR